MPGKHSDCNFYIILEKMKKKKKVLRIAQLGKKNDQKSFKKN
jgi:hypothetical protein